MASASVTVIRVVVDGGGPRAVIVQGAGGRLRLVEVPAC